MSEYVSPEYQQLLESVARNNVTPERYGNAALQSAEVVPFYAAEEPDFEDNVFQLPPFKNPDVPEHGFLPPSAA